MSETDSTGSIRSAKIGLLQLRDGTATYPGSILCLRRGRHVLPLHEIRTPFRLFSLQYHPPQPGRGIAERQWDPVRDPLDGSRRKNRNLSSVTR